MKLLLIIFVCVAFGFYLRDVADKARRLARFHLRVVNADKVEMVDEEVEVEEISFTLDNNYDLILSAEIRKDRGSGERYYSYDPRLPGVAGEEKVLYQGRRQFREKIIALYTYDYLRNKSSIICHELKEGRLRLAAFRFTLISQGSKTRLEYEYRAVKRENGYESFYNKGFPTKEQNPALLDPNAFFSDPGSPPNECSYDIVWLRGTKSALTRYPRLLPYYLGQKDKRLSCLGKLSRRENGD